MKLGSSIFSLFLTLFIVVSFGEATIQDYTTAKVCSGASQDEPKSGTDLDHYNHLKRMYTNCTYVLGNVIVHSMKSLNNVSLDFFSSIVEVSGYVRVMGDMPLGVTNLPFSRLKIIRGESLTKYSDTHENEFSLFIYNVNQITSLGLTELREISRGNVFISYNARNCYGDNIDWLDIFQHTDVQRTNITIRDSAACKPKDERCDSSCTDGYCWGPGPTQCQQLNKEVCADQCDYRCYGKQSNQCCRSGCLAGCDGPSDTQCWGCRDFYNNGTCVAECPRATIYNKTTYNFEKNPDAKVAFGKLCLPSCPDGYLEFNEGCLQHKCPEGYKDVDGKCIECDGPCGGPKECDWLFLKGKNTYWVTASLLENATYQNCSKIIGSVELIYSSFTDDEYIRERAITAEDLKFFETVEHITGTFYFEPAHLLSTVTSLDMFRNLKIVDGKGSSDGFGISIISDHIKSFDLNSLPKLSVGGVNIMAPELCYATSDLLEDIFKSADTVTTSIPESAAETCALEGNVCHAECNSTCIGPASSQCFACSPETGDCSLECKNFEFEGECVETCSVTDHYINGTSCMNCHEECGGGCTGPLNTDCFSCKNYKNGNRCLPKCPNPTYANENKTCQPCNNFCSFDKELSCLGPEPFIASDGCDSCALIEIEDYKKIFPKCLNSSNSCPPGFLSYSQKLIIADFVNESVDLSAVDQACMKCEVQCAACIGKPRYCTKCSSIAYSVTKQNGADGDCTLICDPTKYFIDETSRNCHECSDQCRGGCTGKTDKDCISCSVNKLVLNATENLFQCVTICPPTHNYTIYDKDGPKCVNYKSYMASKLGANKTAPPLPVRVDIIIGSVFAALVVFAVTAVIMAYYCRQKKKHIEKAKELELQLFGTGNAEPVMPTDAEPDLARLRLVKESELKRGDIIGSGAFGTVFKGYLIPDNENVKVPVAIKVLIEGTSPSQNTELLDEARVMASVEHPCCIKIVAVCMTAQMMLITPLMPEGCLLSYVKAHAGQLGSKIIMNWCAQISKGMEHLQRCGIVHRDLAARNVLVHSEHQVKITDFGLAKLLDVGEEYYKADSGKVPIKWMALESIQHRIFNHQTDVWSYGVTVWEILTFGQKPYDGVKARDIALFIERGERLTQPTISTIDVYMILIKCWMLDANTRPTFEDLSKEFTKMARDPGRYLVIDGDQLKRNPTLKKNHDWLLDDMDIDAEYPNKLVVDPDDYLSPSIASASYPRYENEDLVPPPFEKSFPPSSSADNLHSPLRYTSSPTLRSFSDTGKLIVDTQTNDEYLQPVSARGTLKSAPAVDDDGYLQPQSYSGYIDVLADDRTDGAHMKKANETNEEGDMSHSPLLVADNSIYLTNKDGVDAQQTTSSPLDVANPIYMSNNNGSPPLHKQSMNPQYQNLDYVNQEVNC